MSIHRFISGARMALRSEVLRALHDQRRAIATRRLASIEERSKLHLGCGPNKFPSWVNVDIDRWARPDLRHDLRLGLPAPPATVAFIYSEHVFEHLDLAAGERLLRDMRRGLCAGGVLRIAMPDLASLVSHYLGDWRDQAWLRDGPYASIRTGAEMLNVALRDWGHRYVYDYDDLHHRLSTAGFTDIQRVEWGRSEHPELRDLETRPDSRLVVEASVA